jgi:hypothetical protein
MSLIDLSGFNNLRWGSDTHHVQFPSGEKRVAWGQPVIPERPKEIETQTEHLRELELFPQERMQTAGQHNSPRIENHNSPSAEAPPRR